MYVYGSKPSDYTMYETQLNQLLDVVGGGGGGGGSGGKRNKGPKRKRSRKEELYKSASTP